MTDFIERLKRLNAQRTQGEWILQQSHYANEICQIVHSDGVSYVIGPKKRMSDSAFIVAAANNMGKLLAVVEAAEDIVRNYEIHEDCHCCHDNKTRLLVMEKELEALNEKLPDSYLKVIVKGEDYYASSIPVDNVKQMARELLELSVDKLHIENLEKRLAAAETVVEAAKMVMEYHDWHNDTSELGELKDALEALMSTKDV